MAAGAGVSALLEVDDVRKRFGGLAALDGVSFSVAPREIVGLIGPNGAGKTTLFEVVSGFLAPDAGRIRFEGRDVTRLGVHRRARLGVGRTFQIVQPFLHLTVRDNVTAAALGPGGRVAEARDRAAAVLERVRLAERARTPARQLTLPEKKRLELARALAIVPRLLLLDEVMAGLTPAEVDGLMAVLRAIRDDGIALVVVEHVMRAAMGLSDRLVVLTNGRKLTEGSPDEVARDPRVVEAYLGRRHGSLHVVA